MAARENYDECALAILDSSISRSVIPDDPCLSTCFHILCVQQMNSYELLQVCLNYLHVAALWARDEDVSKFIADGADLNADVEGGYTALHIAAIMGHTTTLQVLSIAFSLLLSGQPDWAAPSASQLLVAAGANRFRHDARGFTPLHFAVLRSETDCLKALLAAGQPGEAGLGARNCLDRTAMELAVLENRVEHVRLLLDAGYDVNARSTVLGSTLLHICAYGSDGNSVKTTEIMPMILAKGADVNIFDNRSDHVRLASCVGPLVRNFLNKESHDRGSKLSP